MPNPIVEAMKSHPKASEKYKVLNRGRPEREPKDAAKSVLRRRAFGRKMRKMREDAELTLKDAALRSGMMSSRRLAQYETTCYPPGHVVRKLAPLYNISEQDMAELVIMHSDPDLYQALTGSPGYQPHSRAIRKFLEQN